MCDYTICGCIATTCSVKTFYGADDWTGGTVAGPDEGVLGDELNVNGSALPKSFVNREAYQIEFELVAGSAAIEIDGYRYEANAETQKIRIVGDDHDQEIPVGYTGTPRDGFPGEPYSGLRKVQIRVTPTHTYLFASGNYQYGRADGFGFTAYPLNGHGMLTLDRDGSRPPSSFTATWGEAVVSDFRIRSSESTFDSEGAPVLDCHVLPNGFSVNPGSNPPSWSHTPYLVLKALTQNHLYHDSPGGDLFVPDLSFVNEYSVAGSDSGTWVGDGVAWGNSPGSYDAYLATNGVVEVSRGGIFNGGYWGFFLGGEGPRSASVPASAFVPWSRVHRANGSIQLDFGTPSSGSPYPKPQYLAQVDMNHSSSKSATPGSPYASSITNGSNSEQIEVNDLVDGFSVTASASEVLTGTVPEAYRTGDASITWTV